MPITFNRLTTPLASTTNQSTAYTMAAAGTTGADEILIAFTSCAGNATIGTMSGGGLTWTNITSQTKNAGADVCGVFWAYAATATSVQPSYTPNAAATGCIIHCIRVAGSTGDASGPNLQQVTATATGTTANPTITFGTATLAANGILIFAANGTNNAAQFTAPSTPAGWVEINEANFNTPTNGSQVSSLTNGGTSTTYTWTNANTTSWRTFGLEFVSVSSAGKTQTIFLVDDNDGAF